MADRITAAGEHGQNHFVAAVRRGGKGVTEGRQERYLQHPDAVVVPTCRGGILVNLGPMQPSVRAGVATMGPFNKVLRGIKKL